MPTRRWNCFVCGIGDNYADRDRCRNCGAYPPEAVKGRAAKGNGKGATGMGKGFGGGFREGSNLASSPTFAQRQLERQRQENKGKQQQQKLAELRKLKEEVQQEHLRLQKELEAARMSGSPMDGVEEGPEPLTEKERGEQIERARNSLPYFEARFGKDSAEAQEVRDELEILHKAAREAKPYKTHRAQLEKKKERLERQQETDAKKVDDIKGKIVELQSQLAETEAAIAERSKALELVDGELKDLLLKAIDPSQGGGGGGGGSSNDDPHRAWQTVTNTMAAMASMPGVPAEWGLALQGLLAQIHTATAAMGAAAAVGRSAGGTTSTPPAATGAAAQYSMHVHEQSQQEQQPAGEEAASLRDQQCQVWQAHRQLAEQRQLNEQLRAQQLQQQGGEGGGDGIPRHQSQPVLDLGKLAADGAAATDQERAVQVAAREAAAAVAAKAGAVVAAGTDIGGRGNATDGLGGERNRGSGGGCGSGSGNRSRSRSRSSHKGNTEAVAENEENGTAVAASGNLQSSLVADEGGASDYTGGLESSDEDKEDWEMETIVDKVPADQRASVRAILTARKDRSGRRLQRQRKNGQDGSAAPRSTRKHQK